jgi:hypothetical protein
MALRALALLAAILALPVDCAHAQGFLDFLFGSDGPPSSRSAGGFSRAHSGPGFSTYEPASPFGGLFGPGANEMPLPHERAAYRTLCVRMCDGFYFPISHATSSANFAHDAEICAASCGGEARLFYYPHSGGSIESMLDMAGRAYASYPVAFRYRKTLVQGCQCRPQPWTAAERARHQSYAVAQAPASRPAAANFAPVDSPGVTTEPFQSPDVLSGVAARGDFGAVPRPDPVPRQPQAEPWNGFSQPGPTVPARSRYSWPGMR